MASSPIFVRFFESKRIEIKRLFTENDVTVFGMCRNQADQIRRYFTYSQIFVVPNENKDLWDAELGYEIDTR